MGTNSHMNRVGKGREGRLYIHCPACDIEHPLDDRWEFNGDMKKPTFSPSLRFQGGKYRGEEYIRLHCHSQIEKGMIKFYKDSNHELAGFKIKLPEIKEASV